MLAKQSSHTTAYLARGSARLDSRLPDNQAQLHSSSCCVVLCCASSIFSTKWTIVILVSGRSLECMKQLSMGCLEEQNPQSSGQAVAQEDEDGDLIQ